MEKPSGIPDDTINYYSMCFSLLSKFLPGIIQVKFIQDSGADIKKYRIWFLTYGCRTLMNYTDHPVLLMHCMRTKKKDKSRESKEYNSNNILDLAARTKRWLHSNSSIFHPLKHRPASAGLKHAQKLHGTKSSGYTFIKVWNRKDRGTNTLLLFWHLCPFVGEAQMSDQPCNNKLSLECVLM